MLDGAHCVPLSVIAFEMWTCGRRKGHQGDCGAPRLSKSYPRWTSVFFQEKGLFGWRIKGLGYTIRPEVDSQKIEQELSRRMKVTGAQLRIVDRFGKVLFE